MAIVTFVGGADAPDNITAFGINFKRGVGISLENIPEKLKNHAEFKIENVVVKPNPISKTKGK